MAIKIGNLDISSFKLGGDDCSIYLGSVKLYPSEEPTPPTNWVLVEDTFANPRKIKVDYSLIEDDDSEIREDYQLYSQDLDTCEILYLNQPTIEWLIEHGYGGDELVDYYQKVGLFNDGIISILEDGVEYTSIGGVNLSDYTLSYTSSSMPNYYLYATL